MSARVWLDVPFSEKDTAKRNGARWDPSARRWYAPNDQVTERCRRWVAAPDLPEVFPGEDRTFGGDVLFVDMVPKSCWFTNVRSCVSPTDWDRIRRVVYGRAGQRCEVCGASPNRAQKQYLEAHERWHYDTDRRVQSLRRLIALCTDCHMATHYGFAELRGRDRQAREHLAAVNRWSPQDVRLHIEGAVELWHTRNRVKWDLDLSLLTDVDVQVNPPTRS